MTATEPTSRFRAHRSTIVVALLLLVFCLLLMVPSISTPVSISSVSPFEMRAPGFRHGWPLTYLERTDGMLMIGLRKDPYSIPWLSWDAWTDWQGEERHDFLPWNLCIDLLVLLVIVFLPATAWEWRRRRRRRLLQFKLSELVILFTGISIALGWLAYQRKEYNREQAHLEELEYPEGKNGSHGLGSQGLCAYGFDHVPGWIPRLIGEEIIPDYSSRVTRLLYNFSDPELDETPLSFTDALPHIQALKKLTWLQVCVPTDRIANPYSLLAKLPQLRTLEIDYIGIYGPLNEAEAKELAIAQQITKLIFLSRNDVTPAAKKILRERMPNCVVSYLEDE